MKPACFRCIFIDALQELTWLSTAADDDGDIIWSVEYLSRGPQWFHFQGCRRSGLTVTNGRRFDARTGDVSDADSNIMTFALLDFLDNAHIAAYMGPHSTSTRIAQRMIDAQLLAPEIIKICLEREIPSECGTQTSAATRFAFIGLQTVVDVDDVGTGLGLAATVNQASPFWYRDRMRIVPALTASPLAWPIA